ncbi:1-aminocyclopropane-1-carboxylate deaminase/D-cysteine desulfhydrase [Vibrio gallicus]|uniref:1-aminocyclopropane-1-carboxylate deaminase/D-cysteine desulfhydrase n=1 Tax=Vibrio gallicus TaxID=190897 RepID=UPI0021C2D0B9|nr:1-aminocyclopropane-1-carboxylate deaminase/D-cysteine desulfhydrase [Vibrio gallicus]
MKLESSPITQHDFQNFTFYLKRDDQLHQHFSGNKARKFMQLLKNPPQGIDTIIGTGSIQANSLYSLAALCRIKKWKLEFYTHNIPDWLKQKPTGNYRGALELGAQIIECKDIHPQYYIENVRQPQANCLVVPEGGRSQLAESGIKGLAQEIISWSRFRANKQFVLALPSGTGTTALYLHKYLKRHNIPVITCACVGGNAYLKKQWQELGEADTPTILQSQYKHHFGKLYKNEYVLWQALLKQTMVEFDLLYDPYMWQCLLPWIKNNPNKELIYLHQGGLLGNETMQPRYQRKFDAS